MTKNRPTSARSQHTDTTGLSLKCVISFAHKGCQASLTVTQNHHLKMCLYSAFRGFYSTALSHPNTSHLAHSLCSQWPDVSQSEQSRNHNQCLCSRSTPHHQCQITSSYQYEKTNRSIPKNKLIKQKHASF